MLLEELIDGQEITVATLLDEVLPVIEIIPPSGGEFDYENKYNGKSRELCPPQSISPDIQKQAQSLTKQIQDLLGVRDLSRTDFMIDGEGALWILETNTIPGLTDESLLPKAAGVAGYGMPDVCRMLVEAALARQA
jgi:D-alanine-D-alanine ligase